MINIEDWGLIGERVGMRGSTFEEIVKGIYYFCVFVDVVKPWDLD